MDVTYYACQYIPLMTFCFPSATGPAATSRTATASAAGGARVVSGDCTEADEVIGVAAVQS